jgi:hypothetical protein
LVQLASGSYQTALEAFDYRLAIGSPQDDVVPLLTATLNVSPPSAVLESTIQPESQVLQLVSAPAIVSSPKGSVREEVLSRLRSSEWEMMYATGRHRDATRPWSSIPVWEQVAQLIVTPEKEGSEAEASE